MGDIIPFPGQGNRYSREALQKNIKNQSRTALETQGSSDRSNASPSELADAIGKAYKFWFLLPSVPPDDRAFISSLRMFLDCLNALAAEHGLHTIKALGGVYVDLAGHSLSWEKSPAGQTVLSAPPSASPDELQEFIAAALCSRRSKPN